ncbi:hypothetical protein AWB69_00033 [Caballeronia udeis]|uniref:Uncharacterized protein n=1 Tax=Caballeronia udeis TaxID=1232866 RepID=A0A158EQQ2_9BURK|nr:hypothetical protein [Caballeronia udeis]SAL09419.1 hypothetical protein AWB69_00033 [Caballeronia udeis]
MGESEKPNFTVIGDTVYTLPPDRLAEFLERQLEVSRDASIVIEQWFRRDLWAPEEAFMLLLNIDPEESSVGESTRFVGGLKPLLEFARIKYLDGRCIHAEIWTSLIERGFAPRDLARKVRMVVRDTSQRYREMMSLWQSGEHPGRNPPSYYAQWARSKDFAVPWPDTSKPHAEAVKTGSADADADLMNRRIKAIVNAASALGFDLKSIERGGKKKVESACLEMKDAELGFTQSTFKKAWVEASKSDSISVEDKEKYKKR